MESAVIYARYSSDNQRQESISAQVHDCREYADKNGLVIVKTYIDEAMSATTDERPEFLKMIQDAKAGFFDYVLVHKLDRFARNRYDSAIYKKKLRDSGIKIISITQPLDDSPESAILESVLEGMDEYYSKNLAREAMKGLKENARKCLHNGGVPPLGYDVTKEKKYIINEEEAAIVRLIFEMYAKGQGYTKIIDELTRIGYKTKRGQPFSKNSIYEILRNEKYNGVYVYNRVVSKENGKRNNHKEKNGAEVIRIPKGIPRLIEEKLFKNVQAIMDSRKLHSERARQKAVINYLLSGLVVCGRCGGKMVGNTIRRPKIYGYYECNFRERQKTCDAPRIRKERLEELALEVMDENIFVSIPELLERVNELNKEQDIEITRNLKSINETLIAIKSNNENLLKAIEAGGFSQVIHNKIIENEKVETELLVRLKEYTKKQKASNISTELMSSMLEEARKKIYIYKDEVETKNLINKFINQVVVNEDEIEISLNLILDTNGGGGGS